MRLPSLRDATYAGLVFVLAVWLLAGRAGQVNVHVPENAVIRIEWNPTISGTVVATVAPVPKLRIEVPIVGKPTIHVTIEPTP